MSSSPPAAAAARNPKTGRAGQRQLGAAASGERLAGGAERPALGGAANGRCPTETASAAAGPEAALRKKRLGAARSLEAETLSGAGSSSSSNNNNNNNNNHDNNNSTSSRNPAMDVGQTTMAIGAAQPASTTSSGLAGLAASRPAMFNFRHLTRSKRRTVSQWPQGRLQQQQQQRAAQEGAGTRMQPRRGSARAQNDSGGEEKTDDDDDEPAELDADAQGDKDEDGGGDDDDDDAHDDAVEEDEDGDEDDEDEDDDDEDDDEDDEEQAARKAAGGGAGPNECPCEPFASRITCDGSQVTDVDLISYKEICQMAHLQPSHVEACTGAGLALQVTQFSLPSAAVRRSSLQEESGAYYELCTTPEEQAIRQRYSWHPPSLRSLAQVERFFEGFARDRVPRASPEAADGKAPVGYRERQIAFQLPTQDMALEYCQYPLSEPARAAYLQFIERRNSHALDVAAVLEVRAGSPRAATPRASCGALQRCRRCLVRLDEGQLAVVAPNFVLGSALYQRATLPVPGGGGGGGGCELAASRGRRAGGHGKLAAGANQALFHGNCFTCSTCKEFLVDLVYCLRDNKLYCVRHYGESLRPRCGWCEELIFSDEYLKAMNESFHVDHFLCRQCDSNLAGQRYVLKEDKPYCVACYEANFANRCEDCRQAIGIDSRDLSYKDRHWHDTCFVCNKCQQSLLDKPFGSKADKVYCADCYDLTFAARCDGCNNPFRTGSKKMEYRGRQWHDSCFCCCVCQNTIGSNSFIPKDEQVYCVKCYEDKYATRCTKCRQVITSGGVAFRNEPWHRDCFNCCNCNKSLAGQRFTTRDVVQETVRNTNRTKQPHNAYCIDCYGELFAKKCHACSQPITGLGGTRFVSFEDRSWHNDCFICNDCQVSLVGKGFITDGPESILCGDCARSKLS